jgi:hypothetical protein
MATNPSSPDDAAFRAKARRLERRVRKRLEQTEEALEAYSDHVSGVGPRRSRRDDPNDAIIARFGAATYSFKPSRDGSARVQINGKEFELPPVLAQLLDILASNDGESEDDFVGWKTPDDVATSLKQRLGRTFKPHAVTQAKHRLRTRLEEEGISKHLVQTNSRHRTRFALRRDLAPAAGP